MTSLHCPCGCLPAYETSGGCCRCTVRIYCGLCQAVGCGVHYPNWAEEHFKAFHENQSMVQV
jgi:hypothetical protein